MNRVGGCWLIFTMAIWAFAWSAPQEPQAEGKAAEAKQVEEKGQEEKGKGGKAKGNGKTAATATATVVVKVTLGGEPLEAARVWVSDEKDYESERPTNGSGQASFSGVPRGRVQVQVKPPNGSRTGRFVDVASGQETVTFDLPKP